MLLPSNRKTLLRKYEKAMFYSDYPRHRRVYIFYLIVRPMLKWLEPEMNKLGFNEHELESELYLLCERVFSKYNKDQSSIVPYIEKQLPWYTSMMLRILRKTQLRETPIGLTGPEPINSDINTEFYWRIPDILFLHRWVGKTFTKGQLYTILTIITADDDELSQQKLADASNVDQQTMRKMLSELGETMSTGGII